MHVANITGAIHGLWLGPIEVQAKPKSPIVSNGARNNKTRSLLSAYRVASPSFFMIWLCLQRSGMCNAYPMKYPMITAQKVRPLVMVLKPHWLNTRVNDSMQMKIKASENPESKDKQRTMGSVANMMNGLAQIVKTSLTSSPFLNVLGP